MALTDGHVEATEASPLLGNDVPKSAVNGSSSALPNGSTEHGTVASTATSADEEAGAATVDNPLLDGMPDVAAQLKWLLPAVGIGVSPCTSAQEP